MSIDRIGRYQVRKELGRGGMATVFQAFDPEFERDVAIKVLPREFLHDPNFRARFKREAKIIAGLEHPAIVPVYDYGEEDGQPFIVMRLMPGGSLAERIQAGPLSLAEVIRIAARLASALDEAHRRGIVHRDLKPANILFDGRGDPYISDFGIAKLSEGGSSMTGSLIVGTPAYMSPEQARGERDVDGRSDIYAFGVILFEGLSGKLPYEADTPMGLAVKHITEPVPRLGLLAPDLPPGCEAVISRAMAKERSERFATAAELASTLARAAQARPTAALARAAPRRRVPIWAWAFGALALLSCLALAGLGGGGLLLASLAPDPTPSLAAVLPATPAPATVAATTLAATPIPATAVIVLGAPTASPMATDTALPRPNIYEFRTCPEACLPDGSNAVTTFPEKTTRIYLHWRFENIPIGAAYGRNWTNRNEAWVRYQCKWPGPTTGEMNGALREPGGLRSGYWEITIRVNGDVLLQKRILIRGQWGLWSPAGDINQCS